MKHRMLPAGTETPKMPEAEVMLVRFCSAIIDVDTQSADTLIFSSKEFTIKQKNNVDTRRWKVGKKRREIRDLIFRLAEFAQKITPMLSAGGAVEPLATGIALAGLTVLIQVCTIHAPRRNAVKLGPRQLNATDIVLIFSSLLLKKAKVKP